MRFTPGYGEYYWTIFSDGAVIRLRNNATEACEARIALGNVFAERADALLGVEKIRRALTSPD